MKYIRILSDYTNTENPTSITITESNAGNIEVSIYASKREEKSFILAGFGGGSRFNKNGTEIYLKLREIIELCKDEIDNDKYNRVSEFLHYVDDTNE